jgi:hypothetical protein
MAAMEYSGYVDNNIAICRLISDDADKITDGEVSIARYHIAVSLIFVCWIHLQANKLGYSDPTP